jgi:hypothetical protein
MKILRNLFLTAGMLVLAGCTAFSSFSEVEALNDAKPVGSPFTQALTAEYRNYSNTELKDMFDYPDALHFARKGLAAAAGDTVLPEPIADWNLSEGAEQELSAARGRLIVAYDLGARESAPALAARAQAKFDCWIEQQEETWGTANVPSCKNEFLKAMAELEAGLSPPAPQAEAAPLDYGVDASAPMAAENAMYLVFFDWDKHNLGTSTTSARALKASSTRLLPKSRRTRLLRSMSSATPTHPARQTTTSASLCAARTLFVMRSSPVASPPTSSTRMLEAKKNCSCRHRTMFANRPTAA